MTAPPKPLANGSIKIQPSIIIQGLIVAVLIGGFWRMWDTQSAQAVTLGKMEVKMVHFEEIKVEVVSLRTAMIELSAALNDHMIWEQKMYESGKHQ